MYNSTQRRSAIAVAIVLSLMLMTAIAPARADGGVKVFLDSTIRLNLAARTITLPLFAGTHQTPDGKTITIFFVVTESSSKDDAEARGVSWAPRLANALGTAAVQQVTLVNGVVQFAGIVDFTPTRVVQPGPTGFPPAKAEPGSIGDAKYSPLITTGDGIVINAPQVARSDQVEFHDKVVSIDFAAMRVTLHLTNGFYHGNRILYISTDASSSVAAAIEGATFAPNLNAAPGEGSNEENSARATIIPIVNGQTGVGNPNRQGLQSALMGEGDPLNVTVIHPGGEDYSPLWDANPVVWTDRAIATHQRVLLDHHEKILDAIQEGLIVSGAPGGTPNVSFPGLNAAGFLVNCPIMALLS